MFTELMVVAVDADGVAHDVWIPAEDALDEDFANATLALDSEGFMWRRNDAGGWNVGGWSKVHE